MLDGEGKSDGRIGIALMDNATILALNKRFLDHDEPTDVLSFPLSDPGSRKLEGDLAIGAEMALAQAAVRDHDVQAVLEEVAGHHPGADEPPEGLRVAVEERGDRQRRRE